ncbi:uncharacterized protein [Garra rufa]|uniref:uncharacterized protein n=1 Tax=Garra rufa TaxID=137080 RepID=UPI003CCE9154
MCFIRVLLRVFRSCLRFFFRTLTSLCWRVFSKRLRYTSQINMSDDECEYDSTWEDELENKTRRNKAFYRRNTVYRGRNTYAAKDMQNFRHSCHGLDDVAAADNDDDGDVDGGEEHNFYNLQFYRGEIKSSPDDVYIGDFHKDWWGDYEKLEYVHTYIQWLFPIQEPGVNWKAHELTKKEIKSFRKDEEVKKQLVKSYKLMLDFYGIRLVDESTGEVARAPNWDERFKNLNRYTHNNLRITRILKCLGTLGLKHYQAPLVKFFLHETLVKGQLKKVKQSALDYFMFAVLDKTERKELVKFAFKHFKPREHFVWGPQKILSGQVPHQTETKSQCQGSDIEMRNIVQNKDKPVIPSNSGSHQTEEKSQCQGSDTEIRDETEDEESEDHQNRMKPYESKDEVNKIDPNHNSKEMESKKDHQNKGKPVIPSNSGSHQTEKSPCQGSDTEIRDETKESEDHKNRVKLCESKDTVNKIDPSHNSKEMESKKDQQNKDELVSPSNSVSRHTQEKSPCQGSDTEMRDETEEEESEDGQNRVKPCESKDKVNKIDPNHNSKEMESKKDHQNKDELVSPSNSVSRRTEEKSPCQGSDTEMRDETEDKESEDEQNRVKPCESKDKVNKIDPNHNSKEMESKKDHQNKDKLVSPSNSVSRQTEEKSPCQGSDTEMRDETEDKESEDEQNRVKTC